MKYFRYLSLIAVFLLIAQTVPAQSGQFTYQGKLTDGGSLANGTFQIQFALFDAETGGTQVGSTVENDLVAVTNGIFTVTLDFGTIAFDGSSRWLQVSVKKPADPMFTILSPRQPFTATPYAIKSLNASSADVATDSTKLGGVAANQFVQTNDPRMSDARVPTPGSPDYIQNATTQQAASNFNISGNGKAGVFDAVTQFNIGGSRFLTNAGTRNVFAGIFAGEQNTTGESNTFIGEGAGRNNTTGIDNSFLGQGAGNANTTANFNAFFGHLAGLSNTSGSDNAFFGESAGKSNTTARFNSFFGFQAGFSNTTAENNSFFGFQAGFSNTTGHDNTFFGQGAGASNTTAGNNAFFGSAAGTLNTTGIQNAFFGANAGSANTTGSDNAFVGYGAGQAVTTGRYNAFFGSGAGLRNTTAGNNAFFGYQAGNTNTTGANNAFFGFAAGGGNMTGSNNSAFGDGANFSATNLTNATAIGANAQVSQSNSLVLGSINGVNGATANTNVGIGTTTPTKRLDVSGDALITGTVTANSMTAGDITTNNVSVANAITAFIFRGGTLVGRPVLMSPNGTCWAVVVDNSGGLQTVQAPCP